MIGDKQLMKEINISSVVAAIREHEPISRVELARLTGLGKSTVTTVVRQLLRGGFVEEVGSAESSGGRRPILIRLNPRAKMVVGLKLAPTQVTAGLVTLTGDIVRETHVPLPVANDRIVDALENAVRGVVDAAGLSLESEQILGIGVALPGIVDPVYGTSVSSYFLGWHNVPLKALLERRTGLPVNVDNDANAMALAEALYGAGKGYRHIIGVTVGIGIGAGILIDGHVYRGLHNGAGEIGHLTVDEQGFLCNCGKQGCLEAMAGDAAIVRLAQQFAPQGDLLPGYSTREGVIALAEQGDRAAIQAIETAGRLLGTALANLVNTVNPEVIVIGGEAALQAGELLLAPVRDQIKRRAFSVMADGLAVLPSALGESAWLVGAGATVLQDVFQTPLDGRSRLSIPRLVNTWAEEA